MRATFHVAIRTSSTSGPIEYVRKEMELPCIPAVGQHVESSAWDHPSGRRVTSVVLNLDDASVYVELGEQDISTGDIGLSAFSYKSAGWTLSSGLKKASDEYGSRLGGSKATGRE